MENQIKNIKSWGEFLNENKSTFFNTENDDYLTSRHKEDDLEIREFKQFVNEQNTDNQSHFLFKTEDYGSYEGIVHSDMEKIKNWFLKRGIDYKLYINQLELPVAFLNNINVDLEYRGEGYGNELYSEFEQECYEYDSKCIILESDSGESQMEGFNLDNWYQSFDYEIIGKESGNSIMKKQL